MMIHLFPSEVKPLFVYIRSLGDPVAEIRYMSTLCWVVVPATRVGLSKICSHSLQEGLSQTINYSHLPDSNQ